MTGEHRGPEFGLTTRVATCTAMVLALAAAHPHRNNDADMRTATEQYRLAPIEATHAWPLPKQDRGIERTEAQIPGLVTVNSEGSYNFIKEDMPQPHAQAFRTAINRPLVKYAAEKGSIDTIRVVTGRKENGYFLSGEPGIDFQVGRGKRKNRIYRDARLYSVVADHEAVHSENRRWEAVIDDLYDNDVMPTDEMLDRKLLAVENACQDLRDTHYQDFVAGHRSEIADAFEVSADKLDVAAKKYPEDSIGYGSRRNLGRYMRMAAEATLKDNRKVIDGQLEGVSCDRGDMFAMLYDLPESEYWLGGEYTPGDYEHLFKPFEQQIKPVAAVNRHLTGYAGNTHGCIQEGNAIGDLYNLYKMPELGHPFDGYDEAAASLFTSLQYNAKYVGNCLQNMESTRRKKLAGYIGALTDLTRYVNPGMLEIVERNPDARAFIKEYSNAAAYQYQPDSPVPNHLLTQSGFGLKLIRPSGFRQTTAG